MHVCGLYGAAWQVLTHGGTTRVWTCSYGEGVLVPSLPTCSLVFPTSWPRTGSSRKPWLLSYCQVPFIISSRRMGCSWRAGCLPNHFIPQRPSSGLLCTSIFFFSVDSFPWVRGLSTRNTLTAFLGQYLPN